MDDETEILHNDHMMFLDRALETQRTALLTAMADAVSRVPHGGGTRPLN